MKYLGGVNMEERMLEKRVLSAETKAVLTKLPAPEIVTLMDEMMSGDNNNNNNNTAEIGSHFAMLGREELLKSVEKLPTEKIRDIMRIHGIQ
jgi:hypothetical protein